MIIIILFLLVHNVFAKGVHVDVRKGTVNPVVFAVADMDGASDKEASLGAAVSRIIIDDLVNTSLFTHIPRKEHLSISRDFSIMPQFADWKILNAQLLLQGKVSFVGEGRIQVSFRLWDVYSGTVMSSSSFTTHSKYWRRMAHIIADLVYKRVTGEEGYFDTRIVYVSERGAVSTMEKRLCIMDQDGANHKILTTGKELAITPRFSPNSQKIVYAVFKERIPKVYLLDLETGKQEIVGRFPGLTFAPRFSPDGKKIVMSQAFKGHSVIYTMDLESKKVVRLTEGTDIDTSPCYSPDGQFVVFNSDRSGSKQLYVMKSDGTHVKRISFGGGIYATPVWSPRGDLIAFTKVQKGTFYIGVMKPDGSDERLIATGFLVEGPTWAPNGRILLYWQQEPQKKDGIPGTSRLYTIDITGHNKKQIFTPFNASDPAWSPPLPLA